MKKHKNRYNKKMRNRHKIFLIKGALLSIVPMALLNTLIPGFNLYPLVFLMSLIFLKSPKIALSLTTIGAISYFTHQGLKGLILERDTLLGISIGVGVVGLVATFWLFRKLFSDKFRLNDKTPIMDQVDKIKEGKSSHERGLAFEEFVCDVLKKRGMKAHTTTELRAKGKLPPSIQNSAGSGEQGVDIVAYGEGEKIAIQCKLYSSKVSNSAVQEITTALKLYGADRGVVITNQTFTSSAQELAKANNVDLIDRYSLEDMIKEVA